MADVYCLTVPSTSAFAVEDGLIVHNCVRYIAINWQDIFSVLPSRTDTFAAHRPADRLTGY